MTVLTALSQSLGVTKVPKKVAAKEDLQDGIDDKKILAKYQKEMMPNMTSKVTTKRFY